MECDACTDGYNFSSVTNSMQACTVCATTGWLDICSNYNAGISTSPFRNKRCLNCGVRQNNHKVVSNVVHQ